MAKRGKSPYTPTNAQLLAMEAKQRMVIRRCERTGISEGTYKLARKANVAASRRTISTSLKRLLRRNAGAFDPWRDDPAETVSDRIARLMLAQAGGYTNEPDPIRPGRKLIIAGDLRAAMMVAELTQGKTPVAPQENTAKATTKTLKKIVRERIERPNRASITRETASHEVVTEG